MDACVYPFNRIAAAPPAVAPTREALGLPADAFVLAAFVTPLKLSRRCLKLWRDVLERIRARWLAFSPLEPALRASYERLARAAGLPLDRIVFLPAARDAMNDLARYAIIDAVLDPMPFGNVNGVFEPLQAGVPVVTLLGQRHGERSAYTILAHAGVTGTVARSGREYVDIVARLAGDAAFHACIVAAIRAAHRRFAAGRPAGAHPGAGARVRRRARRAHADVLIDHGFDAAEIDALAAEAGFPFPGSAGRRGRLMADPRLAEADGLILQRRHDAARAMLDALLASPALAMADRHVALLLRAEAQQGLPTRGRDRRPARRHRARAARGQDPHNALGIALADAGDRGSAIAAFRRAVRARSRLPPPRGTASATRCAATGAAARPGRRSSAPSPSTRATRWRGPTSRRSRASRATTPPPKPRSGARWRRSPTTAPP